MRIKTGDIVKAMLPDFPFITDDMVREAAEDGTLKAERNPFKPNSNYFYDPQSLKEYFLNPERFPPNKGMEVLRRLGLNFNQLKLIA